MIRTIDARFDDEGNIVVITEHVCTMTGFRSRMKKTWHTPHLDTYTSESLGPA